MVHRGFFSSRFVAASIGLIVFAALSAAGCSGSKKAEEKQENVGVEGDFGLGYTEGGAEARDLSDVVLEKLDGTTVKISDYEGKILFVTFWATWQKDTPEILDAMNEVQRKFHKNVEVLAVAVDEKGAAAIKVFLRKIPVKYDVFINGQSVADKFGGARVLPTSYVVLRDGTNFWRIDGFKNRKYYSDVVLSLYRRHL